MLSIMINYKPIEFKSQGVTLRGRLYLPRINYNKKHAVIIMAHGFTSTISNMTADKYAEKFQSNGFAVLLYDHRNLGISDGEPRQEINFWVQSRGYIDAIDYAIMQPEIDKSKIAVWGASMSAREAFLVGTIDERVKSIINIIPAFGDTIPSAEEYKAYEFAKETLLADDILALPHSRTEPQPVVSHDQINHQSRLTELTAYRWFLEYGGRFGSNWKNEVSSTVIETPDHFHIARFAHQLKAPILMIVAKNDEMQGASPEVTSRVFKSIKQPKEWVDISGGHFGLLYYPSQLFDKASTAQINFLERYLQ